MNNINLNDLTKYYDFKKHNINADIENTKIAGISQNVENIDTNFIFTAVRGTRMHGIEFLEEAFKRGAFLVLIDQNDEYLLENTEYKSYPVVLVKNLEKVLGGLSSKIYNNPTNRLKIIGITGTAGKTSTSTILFNLLTDFNKNVGLIGSNGIFYSKKKVKTKFTTPQAPELQKIFSEMVSSAVEIVVMEVSSHSIAQGRINGINFDLAAFTNFSQDHLDFHESMDDYFNVKNSFFLENDFFSVNEKVISVYDEWGEKIAASIGSSLDTISNGYIVADWNVKNIFLHNSKTNFDIENYLIEKSIRTVTNLMGEFNVKNVSLAIVLANKIGIPIDDLKNVNVSYSIPGRMELIPNSINRKIIVDYAHKPGSLEEVLKNISKENENIITVLGAGGDRDKQKREPMGAIAARYSKKLIITDDNPRYEEAAGIRKSLLKGANKSKKNKNSIIEVPDRKEAIFTALKDSNESDVILIAGKGDEKGQEINGVVYDFSDMKIVKQFLDDEKC